MSAPAASAKTNATTVRSASAAVKRFTTTRLRAARLSGPLRICRRGLHPYLVNRTQNALSRTPPVVFPWIIATLVCRTGTRRAGRAFGNATRGSAAVVRCGPTAALSQFAPDSSCTRPLSGMAGRVIDHHDVARAGEADRSRGPLLLVTRDGMGGVGLLPEANDEQRWFAATLKVVRPVGGCRPGFRGDPFSRISRHAPCWVRIGRSRRPAT